MTPETAFAAYRAFIDALLALKAGEASATARDLPNDAAAVQVCVDAAFDGFMKAVPDQLLGTELKREAAKELVSATTAARWALLLGEWCG